MVKRTEYDELEQEDLIHQLIADKKEKLKEQEELMPEVTPEQKLTRTVSFILRYMRTTYHPHVIVTNKGYDKLNEVVTLKVNDDIIVDSFITVHVTHNLDLKHKMLDSYTPTQMRVLKEFTSCWNKVVT
jgi:hypothetical protein